MYLAHRFPKAKQLSNNFKDKPVLHRGIVFCEILRHIFMDFILSVIAEIQYCRV